MPIKETTTPPVKRTFEFTPNNLCGGPFYDIVLREHLVCFNIIGRMFVIFDDGSFGVHALDTSGINERKLIETKKLKVTKIIFEEI